MSLRLAANVDQLAIPRLAGRLIAGHGAAPLQCRCFSGSSLRNDHLGPNATVAERIEVLKRRPAKFIPDYLVPVPSHLLDTTLRDLVPSPQAADTSSATKADPPAPLPEGHHLVYFPIQLAPSALMPDGADPDHSPGLPFTRRVWAGGEVHFRDGGGGGSAGRSATDPLLLLDGRPWACREDIADVRATGPPGAEKLFVDVWRRHGLGHEQGPRAAWEIEERRTLAFMRGDEPSASGSSSSPPRLVKYPHPPSFSASCTPSPTHLFHFSALTFNAHSIHLDPNFARSVDGHRALLVHGPLTLALMLRVLAANACDSTANGRTSRRRVRSIVYRNYAPLYVNEELTVRGRQVGAGTEASGEKWDVWVEGPGGGLAVKGTATVR